LIRIRIVGSPPISSVDGIRLDCFDVGQEYEVGNSIGALFLAEGWAAPVPLETPATAQPWSEQDPFDPRHLYTLRSQPRNLIKDRTPPYFESDMAADFRRRRTRRRSRR
jgi:hypothetical protein